MDELVLRKVVANVADAATLAALACTCRLLRRLAAEELAERGEGFIAEAQPFCAGLNAQTCRGCAHARCRCHEPGQAHTSSTPFAARPPAGHCRELRRLLGVAAEPAASARAAALLDGAFRW